MSRTLTVHFLPSLVKPQYLSGSAVVVIDVLRATTTITHALAAGAEAVVPCEKVSEAREIAEKLGEKAILGGERRGRLIEGFDLGNSPEQYTSARVEGRVVVFTTTNGTRAMRFCEQAGRVLIGAFVNFSAVCDAVAGLENVHLLCAGTDGEVSREDVLLAGAIADDLGRRGNNPARLNDQGEIAADTWRSTEGDVTGQDLLAGALRRSLGGQNVLELGLERDIEVAAQIDKFPIAPELDRQNWRIVVPG